MIDSLNQAKADVDLALFKKIALIILKDHNIDHKKYFLSVAFISPQEMKKVNKKYRKKDKPTDVISVELMDNKFNCNQNWLGEILICQKVVYQNSKKYGVTKKEEMIKVFIHGLLHVLGYDHENSEDQAKKMEKREAFYFSKVRF